MIYDAERGDISIAVVGDAMISRRMRAFRELHFLKLVDIIRNADVSIANLEFLFHDYESSWEWTRGTYTRSDPKNLNELKWMGFDAVLTANNHAYDFSEGGFLTTLRHLEDVDLPHAGGGQDLDHSRAPAYVDSPRGRVAVMSASSTFTDVSRAGPGRPDFPGRPGINALRHDLVHHITHDVFEALHKANGSALEKPVDAVAEQKLRLAQQAFDKGQKAYEQGRWTDASRHFADAYAQRPFPQFLYNVAASLHRAGDTMGAVKAYQQYLNAFPDASDADKVRKTIQLLLERSGDALMRP